MEVAGVDTPGGCAKPASAHRGGVVERSGLIVWGNDGVKKVLCALGCALLVALASPQSGQFAQAVVPAPTHGSVVPDTPRTNFPKTLDGTVDAGDQVGNILVYGGTFNAHELPDGTAIPQRYLVAFNVNTGVVVSGFRPVLNGPVTSIEAGDVAGTVFVGGGFTTVNGTAAPRLAKLELATGRLIRTFQGNVNGTVKTMARVGTRLFIGGSFTSVSGLPRANLAEVNTLTGTPSATFTTGVTGLRNSGCRVDGFCGSLTGAIVRSIRATPDGSRLIVMHRGDKVGGLTRWGVAKLNISGRIASVTGWRTDLWDLARNQGRKEAVSIVEGDLSPDGKYLVVSNIFGNFPPLHDTVVAFPTAGESLVQPLWVTQNFDSTYAVAVSDKAVYVGGHFCWTESMAASPAPMYWPGLSGNVYSCAQTSGAVFRPYTTYRGQIAALDPATGHALPWDPRSDGFNGVHFLRTVPRGLMLGHDGARIKSLEVGRAAFFDLQAN